MVEQIKTSMRISHKKFDGEIHNNIDVCLEDMRRCGINTDNMTSLIAKACELYNKAEFDYLGKGEQFKKNYESLRDSMSLGSDYRKGDDSAGVK